MPRAAIVAGISSLLLIALTGCGAPQIGEDPGTFKAVDALYTAVSLRDPKLVDQCAANLKGLHDSGKIPSAASRTLDSIIAEARQGKWEPAFDRLSTFMAGQRR